VHANSANSRAKCAQSVPGLSGEDREALAEPLTQSFALTVEGPGRGPNNWMAFGKFAAGYMPDWYCDDIPRQERAKPLADMLLRQVRAACVGLDAKVIETEIVRAPEKLNKARVKRRRTPLYDYHVLDLTRRRRSATLPEESGTHASPRCHFRRGHWRHLAAFKSWIRWTLVGDPDLGFVDKHYKL
jgi:hypothetical protein